jgi:hypothetical protein
MAGHINALGNNLNFFKQQLTLHRQYTLLWTGTRIGSWENHVMVHLLPIRLSTCFQLRALRYALTRAANRLMASFPSAITTAHRFNCDLSNPEEVSNERLYFVFLRHWLYAL